MMTDNKPRFSNFRGIVTGAAQGIGRRVVDRLLQEGAQVMLNDYDLKALEQAQHDLANFSNQLILS